MMKLLPTREPFPINHPPSRRRTPSYLVHSGVQFTYGDQRDVEMKLSELIKKNRRPSERPFLFLEHFFCAALFFQKGEDKVGVKITGE